MINKDNRKFETQENPILRVSAKILFTPIILFGLYVQFHGDFGPGGGFQAGVIIAGQNGPGVTNLVTGIAQAYKAFSSVISLAGDTSLKQAGMDSFQEIDQQRLFRPITKKTYKIKNINNIPNIINDAFKVSLSPSEFINNFNWFLGIIDSNILFAKKNGGLIPPPI